MLTPAAHRESREIRTRDLCFNFRGQYIHQTRGATMMPTCPLGAALMPARPQIQSLHPCAIGSGRAILAPATHRAYKEVCTRDVCVA